MSNEAKISIGSEARIIQKVMYKRGFWGKHGNNDNGWIGYFIVFGIFIVAFGFTLIINNL